ncbi:hypothetical protein HOK021_47590 [Streptomyces hygroscopicus]|nr:hypothetical protein HOK021_47590 [Streptomyces hygroscopicus]
MTLASVTDGIYLSRAPRRHRSHVGRWDGAVQALRTPARQHASTPARQHASTAGQQCNAATVLPLVGHAGRQLTRLRGRMHLGAAGFAEQLRATQPRSHAPEDPIPPVTAGGSALRCEAEYCPYRPGIDSGCEVCSWLIYCL